MAETIFGDAHQVVIAALIDARRKAGLTQTQLGEKVGRGQRFISLIERGQRRVDVVEWAVLCRAVGVDPVDLYAQVVPGFPKQITL